MAQSRQEARNRPTPEKMKVRIAVTVEVDVHGWVMDYGVHRDDVRDDVRTYVENVVRECNENLTVVKVG